ncbi:MAG TPA: ATP synthase F1 subunit delta [Rubricoccaceae bacterium]|nr:ATP synthase F1 subunit delta [Rubricoccaceae bacterium]
MSNPVARRYALALYEEAAQHGAADRVDGDMGMIAETLQGARELRAAIASPVVPRPKKEALLSRLFDGKVDDLVMRFVKLLVAKQREELLPEIVAAYVALRDERHGLIEAQVRTARPLGYDESRRLEQALAARTGKKVRLRLDVDPSLLGGLVVRVGDRVFDRSLRHQLGLLREQLADRAALSQN